jgi:hypothetical protein
MCKGKRAAKTLAGPKCMERGRGEPSSHGETYQLLGVLGLLDHVHSKMSGKALMISLQVRYSRHKLLLALLDPRRVIPPADIADSILRVKFDSVVFSDVVNVLLIRLAPS